MQGVCEAHAWHDFIDLKIAVKVWATDDHRMETLLGKMRHHVGLTVGALPEDTI